MKEKTIKKEEVGQEYLEQLSEIIDIRKEKREIYGDSFLNNNLHDIMTIIHGKISRLEPIEENASIHHPKYKDEIYDIINYFIFILCLIKKEEKNGNNLS